MAHSLSSTPSTPRFRSHRPRDHRHPPRLALSDAHFVVGISRCSSSIHARRAVAVKAATESPSPPPDPSPDAAPSKEDAKKWPSNPPIDLSFLPSWASWIIGAAVLLAFPFYRRILSIEEKVEKAVEIVGDVAAEAEKISEELAESLPENSELRRVVSKVEMIAEEIAEDAVKVEAIMKKADSVVEEVEQAVEHIIDMEAGEGGKQKERRPTKQSM